MPRQIYGGGLLAPTIAAVGLACSSQEPLPPQPDGWDVDLAAAAAVDLDPDPNAVKIDLTAMPAPLAVRPGTTTEVWTYNGQLPGPVIRAKVGDRLTVRLTNALPEATTIHWHGVRVPVEMDGLTAVKPGETFEYSFQLLDAGTFWYHPHINSSAQVGFGLYGAIVVEDPDQPPLGDNAVMVLSDASIDAAGNLAPGDADGWFGNYFGREGELLLVNGRAAARIVARPGLPQRWRLINAARSKFFRLAIPGAEMIRIGGDGGLLEHPEPIDEITLTPGERADLWLRVRPSSSGTLPVIAKDANRFHVPSVGPDRELMHIDVAADAAVDAPKPPATLRSIDALDTNGAPTKRLELMEKSAPGGAVLGINGLTGAEASPIHASVNTTEVWEVVNATKFDHPFHLHGFFFQLLSIDDVAVSKREWKDTINVQPGKHLKLGIPFDNRPGMWMFHCHILDHADLGMMAMLMLMK